MGHSDDMNSGGSSSLGAPASRRHLCRRRRASSPAIPHSIYRVLIGATVVSISICRHMNVTFTPGV